MVTLLHYSCAADLQYTDCEPPCAQPNATVGAASQALSSGTVQYAMATELVFNVALGSVAGGQAVCRLVP